MLKIRYLIVVGVVAYFIFTLAHLPAIWIAPYVDRLLAPQGMGLTSVSGTVWSGRADLRSSNPSLAPLQGSQLVWALRFSGLWRGQGRADVQVSGNALQLQAQMQMGWKRFGVSDASGEISALFLNALLANTLQVTQPLQLSHVSLHLKRTANPSIEGSGNFFWPKGSMVLTQNPGQTLNMPDMMASLSSVDKGIQLTAKAQDAPVLNIKLDATGMATITVLKRMLVILAQPGGDADPDAMLFEFQQPLF
jgi:hypothetical protein